MQELIGKTKTDQFIRPVDLLQPEENKSTPYNRETIRYRFALPLKHLLNTLQTSSQDTIHTTEQIVTLCKILRESLSAQYLINETLTIHNQTLDTTSSTPLQQRIEDDLSHLGYAYGFSKVVAALCVSLITPSLTRSYHSYLNDVTSFIHADRKSPYAILFATTKTSPQSTKYAQAQSKIQPFTKSKYATA